MTASNDVFLKLSAQVGAPGSERFTKVLAAMMTPEEAQLLIELKTPATAEELAQRLKMDPKGLQAKLADMEHRMIIRKSPHGYVTPPNIVAFHHGAIGWIKEDLKKTVYPLWGDFFFAEWRDIIVDEFEKRRAKGATGAHRIVPLYKALRASPKVDPKQILWYEDMEQILRRADRISFMMCGCRGLWRKCDNPIETCIQLELPGITVRRREAHDFIKPPKDVNFAEAMEILNDCEDRGLVHIPLNTSQGDMYCNCCDDCCMVINPLNHRNLVHEILNPSRYRAVVDQSLCSGCQTCVKRCKFDAIEMKPVPGSKKMKASIINEHCLGCGACVVKCPKKAVTLEMVRPASHIPTVSVMELFTGVKKLN